MKTLMSVCLALGLALPVLAWTQDTSQQGGQSQQSQPTQSQPSTQGQPSTQSQPSTQNQQGSQAQNKQQMSGTVSNNGKTFTSDKDNKSYKIANPDALKGQESQHVTMFVTVDPDTGDLHVVQLVSPAPPQL